METRQIQSNEERGCWRCGSKENFYINPLGNVRHTLFCSTACADTDRVETAIQEAEEDERGVKENGN